ncbi:MAG TPA: HAD-IB family hydrolase [Gammaproteobacteria bacterium]|nr:HAD-IB family hydrolase [Gammaproteobacteria bacterium]
MQDLAIFDLDDTLLRGDSDVLWGEYLVDEGILDNSHRQRHQEYYQQYEEGTLDIMAFLEFQLEILSQHPMQQLDEWRDDYLNKKIKPRLLSKAHDLINHHREQGRILIIVTATNNFVTGPIAKLFDIDNLIATEAEFNEGRYTGKVSGIPSFQAGKVTRLIAWLEKNEIEPGESWFYSDSHNDLPLLEWSDNPVAVDPDDQLRSVAETQDWPIISLR